MALYEYHCSVCLNDFDLVRPMSEAHRSAECPKCNAEAKRIMSGSRPNNGDSTRHSAVLGGVQPTDSVPQARNDWPSAGGTAAQSATSVEDRVAVDSGVDFREIGAPVEMSWLIDYEPLGSNLFFVRDWGVAAMFEYVRHNEESAAAAVLGDPGRSLPIPEQESFSSARSWSDMGRADSSEAGDHSSDLSGQLTDVPGIRPRNYRTETNRDQARRLSSQSGAGQSSGVAGYSPPPKKNPATDFPDHVVRAAWYRQGGRCAGCGRWLTWTQRGKEGASGAWQSHHRIPMDRGGRTIVANCVIFCSGAANCHFNIGHGGIGWSHHAPLDDSPLLFLFRESATLTPPPTPIQPKRSVLRDIFGLPRPKATGRRPAND